MNDPRDYDPFPPPTKWQCDRCGRVLTADRIYECAKCLAPVCLACLSSHGFAHQNEGGSSSAFTLKSAMVKQ